MAPGRSPDSGVNPSPRHWPIVVAGGAALGWWMFHFRGAALFAGVGLAVALGFGAISIYSSRLAAAAAFLGAAFALYSSSTLGWAGTDVPDGSRFKASPVGLSHVLTPARLESQTVDCGWHAVSGYPEPCAVADERAFGRLRAVYPLILFATLLSLAGGAASVPRASRSAVAQRVLAGASGLAAVLGLVVFARSIRPALAAIADLPVGVGGTLGTMQLSLALILSLVVAIGARGTPPPRRSGALAEFDAKPGSTAKVSLR